MIATDKKNKPEWSKEERDRVVAVFQWLLKEDKKQNPHLYEHKKTNSKRGEKAEKYN